MAPSLPRHYPGSSRLWTTPTSDVRQARYGKEFTDRFYATGQRQPTGAHAFDRVCTANRSEHRLTKPRTPQTNGMIERFNGRIAEVLATTRFDSAEHLADTIKRYVKVYNQHIPQKALGHSPPLQAMTNWSQKQTQLFKKCIYNLAGLDIIVQLPCHRRILRSRMRKKRTRGSTTEPAASMWMKSIPRVRNRRSRVSIRSRAACSSSRRKPAAPVS